MLKKVLEETELAVMKQPFGVGKPGLKHHTLSYKVMLLTIAFHYR